MSRAHERNLDSEERLSRPDEDRPEDLEREAELAVDLSGVKQNPRRELAVAVQTSGAVIVHATAEQREAFARLCYDWRPAEVSVWLGSGGLPDDYLYVIVKFGRKGNGERFPDFHCGIDPKGRVSS